MTPRRLRLFGILAGAVALVAIAAFVLFPMTGFGQQDRTALARKTVQTYWGDIHTGKIHSAYGLLTSGNRAARPYSQYSQDMFGYLEQTGGISAQVFWAHVNGDQAVARLNLNLVNANRPLQVYQHLFWENGGWRVSDANGGVTQKP